MTLTCRQRVLNALKGDEVDIAPVANPNSIVTRELQDEVRAYFPDAHHERRGHDRAGAGRAPGMRL